MVGDPSVFLFPGHVPEEGENLGVRLAKLFIADGARDYLAGYK